MSGPASAFGFYKKNASLLSNGNGKGSAQKIKVKYEELTNKKKKIRKLKGVKNAKSRDATMTKDIPEWSERRPQYEPLQNGKGKAKSHAEFDEDSRVTGKKAFQHLLNIDVDQFMKKYWEKKPLLISRKENRKYFSELLSIPQIDAAINKEHIEYTTNVDVTSYKDGQRTTLNPDGRANAPEVWGFYNEGCSVRFLNPHLFFPQIYRMSSAMQEYFTCMVGANVYLTPPNSQGFAPHYDDIEAFVLQVEGKKHWRVYSPREADEELPRVSSPNYAQSEIGKPILDVVLEAGDFLYFPRGYIHQANTVPGHHSLHVTLSTYQKNSWADFMESCVQGALKKAIASEVDLRRGLPLDLSRHMGAVHAYSGDAAESSDRKRLVSQIRGLFNRLGDYLAMDEAADEMQKKYQHDALPPQLSDRELKRSSRGCPVQVAQGIVSQSGGLFTEATNFRLLKANIARLVVEEGETRLYYHLDNSRYYHEYEPVFLEVEAESAPAVAELIAAYPAYLSASEIRAVDDAEATLNVFAELWKRGLLITKNVPTTTSR